MLFSVAFDKDSAVRNFSNNSSQTLIVVEYNVLADNRIAINICHFSFHPSAASLLLEINFFNAVNCFIAFFESM